MLARGARVLRGQKFDPARNFPKLPHDPPLVPRGRLDACGIKKRRAEPLLRPREI